MEQPQATARGKSLAAGTQRIVWPELVVSTDPVISDLAKILKRVEDVGVEHSVPVKPVEALDEGILVGLAGLHEQDLDVPLAAAGHGAV